MKIEIYYYEDRDAVIIVKDGVAYTHDEAVNSCEYLNGFGIDCVEEFENLNGEEILDTCEAMLADMKNYLSRQEQEEYFEHVRNTQIKGKLITTKYI